MERRIQCLSLCLAIAGTLLFTISASAQCSGGCSSCGGGGGAAAFGYPSDGGCSSGGCGSRGFGSHRNGGGFVNNVKSHYNHLSSVNAKAFERNRAWPKPFNCADRQAYFSIWDQMLTHGYQLNCVFNGSHFNPGTNELNDVGIAKLQGIFRNNPQGQKVAYVANSGAAGDVEARVGNLRNSIARWYGSDTFSEVAATNVAPTVFAGGRVETLHQLGVAKTAAPIIPVASGTGSTQNAGGN